MNAPNLALISYDFRNEQELHVLFNNAGVMAAPVDMKTSNGYDLQFGTNVLGPYLFTVSLLPILIHTAQTRKYKFLYVYTINEEIDVVCRWKS